MKKAPAIPLSKGSPGEKKVLRGSFILAFIFLILDQLTTFCVVKYIPRREKITIIPGCFSLTFITNDGAAWNMLSGKFWLLTLISLCVFVLLVVFVRKLAEGWAERYYGIFLVLSGIAGNSIDRIFRGGEVVDFLHCYIGRYAWPTFNVADSCICVGVFLFIFSNLFRPEKKDLKEEAVEKSGKLQ